MRTTFLTAAVAGLMAISTAATAHIVWLRREPSPPNTFLMLFGGHAGALSPYQLSKLRTVSAMDANGGDLAVTRSGGDDALRLQVEGSPVMLAVHYDNGIYSRTADGPSTQGPMTEVPGAVRGTSAVKYHKTVVAWGSEVLTRPIGQPFEVVPLSAETPQAGRPIRIQVRIDGEPAEGIRVGRTEDTGEAVTDAQGMADFTPQSGFNMIWAGKRIPTTDNPAYTELSYEYSFGFEVP